MCLAIFFEASISRAQQDEEQNQDESLERSFIDSNIAMSKWFDGVAEGLDLFLAGKKLTNKRNNSHVKLESTTFVKERESVNTTGSVNVNLRLPNVEEYWQLKFTSYDETRERSGAETGNLQRVPRERNYGASVGFFQKLGNVRTAFQPRVALQNPVKVSHSLTFESVADLKTYRFNPKFEFFGNPDDGTGVFLALNYNYNLSKIYSLTLINDGEYKSKLHLLSVTNGLSIGQSLSKTTSLSYNLIFDSINQPVYILNTITYSVGWYQLIYKNILDYSVSPYLQCTRDNHFNGVPGFNVTVGLNY
jgi:hypothetical protein